MYESGISKLCTLPLRNSKAVVEHNISMFLLRDTHTFDVSDKSFSGIERKKSSIQQFPP